MLSNISRVLNVAVLATALVTTVSLSTSTASARVPPKPFTSQKIKSLSPKAAQISVARVVESVKLESSDGVLASVVVEDTGGTTDVSPTQNVYLTLYAKGEMYDVDAAFLLANVLQFNSARLLSPGKYEVVAQVYEQNIVQKTFIIDASTALLNMKAVDCAGDFDCDAATKFKAEVEVSSR